MYADMVYKIVLVYVFTYNPRTIGFTHKTAYNTAELSDKNFERDISTVSLGYRVHERPTTSVLTVEPPSKEHSGTALFVLCKEIVLFGRFTMYLNYREELFWDLKLCPL